MVLYVPDFCCHLPAHDPAPSGGGTGEPETQAWRAAVIGAGGAVTDPQNTRVNTLVTTLKTTFGLTMGVSNLSTIFDRIWLYVGENYQQATYDLVAASAATFNGTGAFSTHWSSTLGYTGNGSDNYFNTNVTLGTGTVYALNSCHISAYVQSSRSASPQQMTVIGVSSGGNLSNIQPYETGAAYWNLNETAGQSYGVANAQGLWVVNRTGSTGFTVTRNGVNFGVSPYTAASVAIPTGSPMAIGALGGIGRYSTDSIGSVSFGKDLGTNEVAVSNAFNAYMISFGASFHY